MAKNTKTAEASEKEIRAQYRDIIGGTIDMRDISTILRKVAGVFVSIFALVSGTVRKAETALKAAGIAFDLDAIRDDCAKAIKTAGLKPVGTLVDYAILLSLFGHRGDRFLSLWESGKADARVTRIIYRVLVRPVQSGKATRSIMEVVASIRRVILSVSDMREPLAESYKPSKATVAYMVRKGIEAKTAESQIRKADASQLPLLFTTDESAALTAVLNTWFQNAGTAYFDGNGDPSFAAFATAFDAAAGEYPSFAGLHLDPKTLRVKRTKVDTIPVPVDNPETDNTDTTPEIASPLCEEKIDTPLSDTKLDNDNAERAHFERAAAAAAGEAPPCDNPNTGATVEAPARKAAAQTKAPRLRKSRKA
jgi:hypothetical protein